MKYKILVVDDEEYMHIVASSYLEKEFTVFKAKNVQEAIDILSKESIQLILSDIHMPGMSGLDFLKSIRNNEKKGQIPILIMTQLPTAEKEKKALSLGAADFIDKGVFVNDKQNVLKRIRMKLVSSVPYANIDNDLLTKKSSFTSQILESALSQNFEQISWKLTGEIANQFKADYVGFWSVLDESDRQVSSGGRFGNKMLTDESLKVQNGYNRLSHTRKPYLSNNILTDHNGFYTEFSRENNLPAEIGIPVFAANVREMLMMNKEIPTDASLFGVVVIKRNELFSTEEFEIISRLVIQSGSIIWDIYKN